VLTAGDRVEIYCEGERGYFAGAVVGVEGGRATVVYDDGDEGSYDMEREVWRLEGDGSEDGEREEEEADEEGEKYEKEGEKEGEKEENGGELDQGESTGRAKKKAAGSWHRCGVGGCAYKCKQSGNIRQHKAHIHGIDVRWFRCDQCAYKCKENSRLKVHKASVHGIDVKWFKCDKCEYKCKENGTLTRHKAAKHK
jgi:hypothetical protein